MLVHLSEEQLALLLAGNDETNAADHLAICTECEQKLESWKTNLRQLRDDISFSSQRSGAYWHIQHKAITSRLEKPAVNNFWNFGWTLACYALALSVLVLVFINFHQPGIIPPKNEITDEALLSDLEDRMTEDVPEALQPANLLVSEMSDTQDQGTKLVHTNSLRKSK